MTRPDVRARSAALRRLVRILYEANLTGNAAMVAYNAVLALLPLVLLGLFVVSTALDSQTVRASLLHDLELMFPGAARNSLDQALRNVQDSTAELGVGALVSGVWMGVSVWSALDTAFSPIYGGPRRGWFEQKRFALKMLLLGLVLVLAVAAIPLIHSVAVLGTARLPLGLDRGGTPEIAASLIVGHGVLFAGLCGVYHLVPTTRVRWRAVWPGALVATSGLAATSYAFPLYLSHVSTLAHAGATFGFVVVVLVWFYLVALLILLGAGVNAAQTAAPGKPAVLDSA